MPLARYGARAESMHVVDRHGTVHSGGDGLIAILAADPRTRLLAWTMRLLPPLRRRVHRKYVAIAARRGELSQRVDDAPLTIDAPVVRRN